MLLIDVLIRYSAVTVLFLLTVLAIRDGRRSVSTRYVILVSVSMIALLLSTAPPELRLHPIPYFVARLIGTTSIGFVWWFGLSILKDDFKLGRLEWTGLLLSAGQTFAYRLVDFGILTSMPAWYDLSTDMVNYLMMGHLVYVAVSGRVDDLIAVRRTLRIYFVLGLSTATGFAVISATLLERSHYGEVSTMRSLFALIIAIWAFIWMTRFHPEKLTFKPVTARASQTDGIDPRDTGLGKRLIEEMQTRHTYLEPNLSIRNLAERLKTPEHRLRMLINQGLGYRNFSSFLNAYRIEAVKRAFADPNNARTPILTIAMDVGYNSLAPFNRAFLKIIGKTPTAYRKNLLAKSDHN